VLHGELTGVLLGELTGVLHGELTGVLHGELTGVSHGELTGVLHGELLLRLEAQGNASLFHRAYKELFSKSLLQIWCMKSMYMIRDCLVISSHKTCYL
jgi:hypothetical protein